MPRKPFLLRIDERILAAIERWAAEDLRSVNGQVEFLLREAVKKRGYPLQEDDAVKDLPSTTPESNDTASE